MAEFNISFNGGIHAEIVVDRTRVFANTPLILDPMTKSYSDYGKIVSYRLEVVESAGLERVIILNNGKNSRFTAGGSGACAIELTIEDEKGNTDTDIVTVTVV